MFLKNIDFLTRSPARVPVSPPLIVSGMAAMLLSGCSWLGDPFDSSRAVQAQNGQYGAYAPSARCQIQFPQQPIPQGCQPHEVTLATGPMNYPNAPQNYAGGFAQQPQFGEPQYADGAYGSAIAATAAAYSIAEGQAAQIEKPKLRGALALGMERSISGNFLSADSGSIDSILSNFDPQNFNEGTIEGTQADGEITTTIYTANDLGATNILAPNAYETFNGSDVSLSDAWSAPVSISAGLEYILNNHTTIFGNAGYTTADGEKFGAGSVQATLYRDTQTDTYSPIDIADPAAGYDLTGTTNSISYIPNQKIAEFDYAVTDLERYNLEVGGRYYFDPLMKSDGFRTLTPFIGGSVGMSHYNAVDVTMAQRQAFYQQAFDAGGSSSEHFYDVVGSTSSASTDRVRVFDAQWVPQGQVNIGAEWQVTPSWALALESGVRIEGAREYADFTDSDGNTVENQKGDTSYSVPLTLRGSVNF